MIQIKVLRWEKQWRDAKRRVCSDLSGEVSSLHLLVPFLNLQRDNNIKGQNTKKEQRDIKTPMMVSCECFQHFALFTVTYPVVGTEALVDSLVPLAGSCVLVFGWQSFVTSVEICHETESEQPVHHCGHHVSKAV